MTEMTANPIASQRRFAWYHSQRKLAPYLFIAPFYVVFLIFFIGPIGYAFYMSFTNWMGMSNYQFIGFKNYVTLWNDDGFWLALRNSIWLSVTGILIVIPLALLLAIMLNQPWLRLRGLFRVVTFAPIATASVAVAVVFLALLDTRTGVINWLLTQVNLAPIPWLDEPAYVKWSILMVFVWRTVGLYMIYYLAGLQAIPHEIYEAAQVDGANTIQSFRHITLPMLRPVTIFVVIVLTIAVLQIFEETFILNRFSMSTGAGPGDAGLTLAFYLYRHGFKQFELGFGAAIGIVIFVLIFGLSLLQMRFLGFFRDE
jgi:multiple sugar transport system permease protein